MRVRNVAKTLSLKEVVWLKVRIFRTIFCKHQHSDITHHFCLKFFTWNQYISQPAFSKKSKFKEKVKVRILIIKGSERRVIGYIRNFFLLKTVPAASFYLFRYFHIHGTVVDCNCKVPDRILAFSLLLVCSHHITFCFQNTALKEISY